MSSLALPPQRRGPLCRPGSYGRIFNPWLMPGSPCAAQGQQRMAVGWQGGMIETGVTAARRGRSPHACCTLAAEQGSGTCIQAAGLARGRGGCRRQQRHLLVQVPLGGYRILQPLIVHNGPLHHPRHKARAGLGSLVGVGITLRSVASITGRQPRQAAQGRCGAPQGRRGERAGGNVRCVPRPARTL